MHICKTKNFSRQDLSKPIDSGVDDQAVDSLEVEDRNNDKLMILRRKRGCPKKTRAVESTHVHKENREHRREVLKV